MKKSITSFPKNSTSSLKTDSRKLPARYSGKVKGTLTLQNEIIDQPVDDVRENVDFSLRREHHQIQRLVFGRGRLDQHGDGLGLEREARNRNALLFSGNFPAKGRA